MHRFETLFSLWVIRYRWPIILATLMVVAAAASGARFLEFTTNYRVFFSPDNPQLRAFEALENTYNKEDNAFIVLAPRDGNVFTPDTLALVRQLTEQAWQTPFSTRVDSITNFQHTEAEEDDLIVADLLANETEITPEVIAKVRQVALSEPLLVNHLVSPEWHVTGVNITIEYPRKNEAEEVPMVVSFVRELAETVRSSHPDVDVYLTGVAMLNNAFMEASLKDWATLLPASFVIMLVSLALLLRGLAGTFSTLLVILFSIVTGMGLGGYLGIPLTPPSASSPIMILTLAIASSVHVLVSFYHSLRQGHDKKSAMAEGLRINLQPVFLTSLTTALGFLSMNFSEAPPFRDLGNLVAMGVAASFVYSVTFLPALMTLLPVRVHHDHEKNSRAMRRLAEFVIHRRTALLWGVGALMIALIALVPRNELNDVFPHYFAKSVQFRVDSDFVDQNLGGMYRFGYSLDSKESSGISEPQFLQRVDAFARWWRQQPETIHVHSLTDTLRRLNKNMHGDDADWYRLPDQRDLAAQYLLLYEMSLPYGLDLNNQINVDKSATRLAVTIKLMSTNAVLALEKRASDWLEAHAPELADAEGTSPTIMFSHIGARNIRSMLSGVAAALVLISLILVVALRSVKIGLVSMIPNLTPAAMGFGIWGLLNGQVGLGLSVVAGMTLGIVVDDTVHFLSKYLRARREQGLGSEDAVRYAFASVGTALWVTSAVLMAGFGLLALSSFQLNADMGLLTAIVIGLALLADFLFLPPLLITIEGNKDENTVRTPAAGDPARP